MPAFLAIPAMMAAGATVATALAIAAATTLMQAAFFYALYSVMSPKKPTGSLRGQGMQVNLRDPAATRQIIYGQRKVSGVLYPVGVSGTSSEYLHVILLLAGHEVDEIGDIYFGTDIVPLDGSGNATGKYAGFARVKKHLGSDTQTVDTDLQTDLGSTYWTNDHRLRGIAYIYVRLKLSQDLFPAGVPELYAMVKGRKVFDPRNPAHASTDVGTWEWSDNAALCLADWVGGVVQWNYLGDDVRNYGLGAKQGDGEIDNTALIEAANICDESVTLTTIAATAMKSGSEYRIATVGTTNFMAVGAAANTAGEIFTATGAGTGSGTVYIGDAASEKRYTANGVILSSTLPDMGIDMLRTALAGDCVYVNGAWVIRAGAYRTPTVTLTDSNYRAPVGAITLKPSKRDLCNGVRGVFISEENNWMPADFPAVKNATYLTQDNDERLWRDLELPFTTSASMAQRLAKIVLEESRQGITFTARCNLSAYQLQCTDTVMVTNARVGWSAKVFKVVGSALVMEPDANGQPFVGVDLMLRETASGIWTWSAEETAVDLAPDTLLPDGGVVVAASGLALLSDETTSYRQADGVISPRVRVTWTTPTDQAVLAGGRTHIEAKLSSGGSGDWLVKGTVPGDTVEFYLTDVRSGDEIDVRVRHENVFQVRGSYDTESNHVVSQETLVDDPGNLCINGRFAAGDFGWTTAEDWVIESTAGEVGWGARNTGAVLSALRNTRRIACTPGDVFMLRGRVYGANCALIVYFVDNASAEISYYYPSNYGTAGAWTDAAVQVTAPATAVYCYAAAFTTANGDKVDNVSLVRLAQANELGPVSVTPAPGKFSSSVTVTASHADGGATIKYTANGTPVTGASSTFPGGGLTLSGTTTLRVRAYKTGATSPESILVYTEDSTTVQVATPTFSYTGQRGNATISVTASCATSGATIKYKLNGGSTTTYTTAVSVTLNSYIELWAEKTSLITSNVVYLDNTWVSNGGGIEP